MTPLFVFRLLGLGSGHGASVSASTAVDAQISVDLVLGGTLGDRGNGAALGAGAAHDASIGNLVSHNCYLLNKLSTYVETIDIIHLYARVSQHLLKQ